MRKVHPTFVCLSSGDKLSTNFCEILFFFPFSNSVAIKTRVESNPSTGFPLGGDPPTQGCPAD